MKKLYFLNEEEKNRILNLHENATKRQYLSEQNPVQLPPNPYQIALDKMKSDGKAAADKAAADKKTSQDKAKKAQQYKQQIVTKTSDTTKQIQKLLGLPETGNMDSTLLQKINDKLNGKPQEAPKSDVATQPRPKVEPLQTSLKPAGVVQQQLTTPSPEQLTAGLQQQQKAAEAAKTPPTNKEKRQERRDLRASNKAEMQALRDKQRGNQ
jgi:hypothetical protein